MELYVLCRKLQQVQCYQNISVEARRVGASEPIYEDPVCQVKRKTLKCSKQGSIVTVTFPSSSGKYRFKENRISTYLLVRKPLKSVRAVEIQTEKIKLAKLDH